MSVPVEEQSLRRRMLYSAMPAEVSLDVVQQCIDILDNEFGAVEDLRYGAVLKRIKESVNHDYNFGPVLGKIMILKTKSTAALGQDPRELLTGRKVVTDPRDIVFKAVFQSIEDQIDSKGSYLVAEFRRNYELKRTSMEISQKCKTQLSQWAASDNEIDVDADQEEMQAIINEAFVWMCVRFGPVEADKTLHQAISTAGKLKESSQFSPKQLM